MKMKMKSYSPKRKSVKRKRSRRDGRRSPRKPLSDITNTVHNRVVKRRSPSPPRRRSPKKSPRRSPSPQRRQRRLRDGKSKKRNKNKSPLKLRK